MQFNYTLSLFTMLCILTILARSPPFLTFHEADVREKFSLKFTISHDFV